MYRILPAEVRWQPLFRKLAGAGEADGSFLAGKAVADFGCSPRSFLCWAEQARARIGTHVLVDVYRRFGIADHDMVYVESSEGPMPFASDSADVLFTMSTIDHVMDFPRFCNEVLRIMKPGGLLVASFNLNEPASHADPQTLTDGRVNRDRLNHLEVRSRRAAP